MKRRNFMGLSGGAIFGAMLPQAAPALNKNTMTADGKRKIVAYGAGHNPPFVKFVASLTGKPMPRLCYLPTASADSPAGIIRWYGVCAELDVKPFVQNMFITSYEQKQSFDEVLLSMDAIVVGGGNTLNMMAIWKAQGIDLILKKAWDQGIVLAGGSAGSLCWFEEGTTDSRPKELSKVTCLGFIKTSHCPHYDAEEQRRPLYHKLIKEKVLKPGYACDNKAAIYFEDNEVKKVLAVNEESNAYYVYEKNGAIVEDKLPKEVLKS
jgi:dipeptidase E